MDDAEAETQSMRPGDAKSPPPEDLSSDRVLRGCKTVEYDHATRPAIGRIALLSRLGKGGMGVVYHGVNPRLDTEVAVKILPWSSHQEEEGLVDRFVREAKLAAKLRSDHLVTVLDVDKDEDSGNHFLVMEYVRGQSAGAWLRGLVKSGERGVPEAAALDVCIAATKGLEAAHLAGVVHRDIKPDNILIPADAAGRLQFAKSKLADLGLARSETSGASLTGSQFALGTPGYMAPEQAMDAKRAKKPADVFATGVTLYALLAGRSPFAGETAMEAMYKTLQSGHAPVRSVRADVSPATAALIDICLAKDPVQRYPDASALLAALELCRAALAGSGRPEEAISMIASLVQAEERGQRVKTGASAQPRDDAPGAVSTAPPPATQPPAVSVRPTRKRPVARWIVVAALLAGALAGVNALWPDRARPNDPVVSKSPSPAEPGPPKEQPPAPGPRIEPGLYITSEPPGAAVTVDGRRIGLTPVLVSDLATGRHLVEMTLTDYARFESSNAASRTGDRTELSATLVRAVGKVAIEGGAPDARVALVRSGASTKTYDLLLDDTGCLAATDCEAGTYAVTVTHVGFDDFSGQAIIRDAETSVLVATMVEHDALLTVSSKPLGAEVLIDELRLVQPATDETSAKWGIETVRLGRTPLVAAKVPPGDHAITLRLSEYGDMVKQATFAADGTVDLGEIHLSPWPVLDLTGLGDGVTASVGGAARTGRISVPPRRTAVTLRLAGSVDQTQSLDAALGQVIQIRPDPWAALAGRIDISAFASARCSINGETITSGKTLAPGSYTLHAERDGYESQDVPFTVRAGEDARPTPRPWGIAGDAHRLLSDLAAWDAASSAQRRSAAAKVDAADADVTLVNLQTYSCGGQTHEVAIFRHAATGLEFVLVPGGTFQMGSPASERGRSTDEAQHAVTLKPFLIARTELPQSAWGSVSRQSTPSFTGVDLPVENVSWDEATSWCLVNSLALPTEEQWEYACRAGTETAYCFGDSAPDLSKFAWFDSNSGGKTHAAGRDGGEKKPNAFGLYDMHGNVWEWCETEYSAGNRVSRGGSWRYPAAGARSAFRDWNAPGDRFGGLGFRPARFVSTE